MKPVEYKLEIYEPMSVEALWVNFDSSTPFATISTGDILLTETWPELPEPTGAVRVILVEHIIFEVDKKNVHKVMVFTEPFQLVRNLESFLSDKTG